VRHDQFIPFNKTKSQWSCFDEFNVFSSPGNFNAFRIFEPWFRLKDSREQISDIRDGMRNWSNDWPLATPNLGKLTRVDGFLALHGVGEHVVWHSPVTGTETVETIEAGGNADRPPDIGSETHD
jgi:hypothetical protein